MIRTFLDSGILIAASRGDLAASEKSMRVLEDPGRRFLTSVFVRLEVFPKVARHEFPLQRAFLNEFFADRSLEGASDLDAVINLAVSEAERHGLSAMDALHVAAALLLKADQLITTEKPGKPIYRAEGVQVMYVDKLEHLGFRNREHVQAPRATPHPRRERLGPGCRFRLDGGYFPGKWNVSFSFSAQTKSSRSVSSLMV